MLGASSNDRTAYLPDSAQATEVQNVLGDFLGADSLPAYRMSLATMQKARKLLKRLGKQRAHCRVKTGYGALWNAARRERLSGCCPSCAIPSWRGPRDPTVKRILDMGWKRTSGR